MGQSVFVWCIVADDGSSTIVKATPDQLLSVLDMSCVVAVIRVDFDRPELKEVKS